MPDRSSPVLGSFASGVNKPYRRSRRDGAEAPRNSLDYSSMNGRWISAGYEDVPFGFEIPALKNRSIGSTKLCSSQVNSSKQPGVVARLMGLDRFPLETRASKPERYGRADEGFEDNGFRCQRNSARELLDAMQFLQSNKNGFLELLHQKTRFEKLRMEEVPRSLTNVELEDMRSAPPCVPSRIVVLKPGPKKVGRRLSSPGALELPVENPPEKILHVVAQTREATSANLFLKEQLNTGTSNARVIAQAIAREARDDSLASESHQTDGMKTTSTPPSTAATSSLPNTPRSTKLYDENSKCRLIRSRSGKLLEQEHELNKLRAKTLTGVKFHKLHNPDSFDYKEGQTERAARALDFSSVCSSSVLTTYKDVRKADMVYTWKVIFAVLSHSSTGLSWMRNSMLSTRIFQRLELDYQTTGGSSIHRRLLFDVVAEVLARKHQYSWNTTSILSRQKLMREVWGELSRNANLGKDSTKKTLTLSEALWPGADEELNKLGMHLSKDIFSSLIDEAVDDFFQQAYQQGAGV